MSKSTKQALVVLGVIRSGVKAARTCFEHGPEIDGLLNAADRAVNDVIVWWPVTGDELEHWIYAERVLGEWEKSLEAMPQQWTMVANLSVSVMLLDDLYQRTNNPIKKARLSELIGPILAAHDFIRPNWNGYDDYDYAAQAITSLYALF